MPTRTIPGRSSAAVLCTVGSLLSPAAASDRPTPRELELQHCFVRAASRTSAVPMLDAGCGPDLRDESRFWLLGPWGAVYLLRILAPELDRPFEGELLGYEGHRWIRDRQTPRDGRYCRVIQGDIVQRIERLHERSSYDWGRIAQGIEEWSLLDERFLREGRRSLLTLVIETCTGGVYERTDFSQLRELSDDEVRAATTVKGLILILAEEGMPEE